LRKKQGVADRGHVASHRSIDSRAETGRTRYEVFDAQAPGLAVRVTPNGHKSWVLLYRHHGRPRRLTLGRFPDRGLAEARKEALNARGRILNGADPAAEKHDERATYATLSVRCTSCTEKATEKKRSWPEQRRIFENEALPAWRRRRVQDMTYTGHPREAVQKVQRARDQRVPVCESAGGEERSLGPGADESKDGRMPVAEA
jgi:hypothetical protein